MTLDAHEQLESGKQLSTITILVTDEHAPLIDSLLTRSRWSRGVVCEVYSVTGLPTFCWRNTAYFPAHLAELLLARAVVHPSGAMVPFLEDQFRSLAFHALYHDGYDSDLPADRAAYGDGPLEGNRYASELGRLARELGLHIPLTLEDLDSYLDNELIHSRGFKTLVCEVLDQQQIANGTRYLRGGSWGKGPYPSSGGPPHTAIVVVDPSPTPPPQQAKAIHPGLENGRALELKEAIRYWWNERQPDAERCNILHTSDSAAEAVHYVDVLFLERAEKLVDAAHAIAMGSLPPG